jgi:hypothetical protein
MFFAAFHVLQRAPQALRVDDLAWLCCIHALRSFQPGYTVSSRYLASGGAKLKGKKRTEALESLEGWKEVCGYVAPGLYNIIMAT